VPRPMGVPRRMPRRTTRAPISKPTDDTNDGKHARALGSPLGDIVKDAKCMLVHGPFQRQFQK
jgi:hypothetical protein